MYEEIIERAMKRAHVWHDLREKIEKEIWAFWAIRDVKEAHNVYVDRVSFAFTLVGKHMQEYNELARLIIDFYTAAYIRKNVLDYQDHDRSWGEYSFSPVDERPRWEWHSHPYIKKKAEALVIESSKEDGWHWAVREYSFKKFSTYLADEIRKLNEREALTPEGRIKIEIFTIFLGVFMRLVDFYYLHTTFKFQDFYRVIRDLYANKKVEDFLHTAEFILGRILQVTEEKEEYYKNEARYWHEHGLTRPFTSTRMPHEVLQVVWKHMRDDVTEDEETRRINTPRYLRNP